MAEIKALVGDKVLGKNGLEEVEELCKDADALGLYFSAHWCPPCRQFTPKLAEFYKKVRAQNKKFEVIFVSCDRGEDDFKEYYDTMPWHALPFVDREKKNVLSQKYKVKGIPALIILGSDGTLQRSDGRMWVQSDKWD